MAQSRILGGVTGCGYTMLGVPFGSDWISIGAPCIESLLDGVQVAVSTR